MAALSTVYCTDEQIAIRVGGDFVLLCPKWQKLAAGTDGAFTTGALWTMSSATASFVVAGLAPGNVMWLTSPATAFKGGGELFGVDSVTATTATLHRIGMASGEGLPPSPAAGLTTVAYTALTLSPQIEEASFWVNQTYNIDPDWPGRAPADAWDLRDIRDCCVLTVIVRRLVSELQDNPNVGWGLKLESYRRELSDVQSRVKLRWAQDDRRAPSNWFSTRIVR